MALGRDFLRVAGCMTAADADRLAVPAGIAAAAAAAAAAVDCVPLARKH